MGECRLVRSRAHKFDNLSRTVTWDSARPNKTAVCISNWLNVRGNYLELELAGYADPEDAQAVRLIVEGENEKGLTEFYPRTEQQSGVWKRAVFVFGAQQEEKRLRLKIIDNSAEAGWIALRNRANFYEASVFSYRTYLLFSRGAGRCLSVILLSAALAGFLLWCAAFPAERIRIFMVVFICAALMHFRKDVYFNGDDYMFLERFLKEGFRALLFKHNEHVYTVVCRLDVSSVHFFKR